jgi:hypothetical protein
MRSESKTRNNQTFAPAQHNRKAIELCANVARSVGGALVILTPFIYDNTRLQDETISDSGAADSAKQARAHSK